MTNCANAAMDEKGDVIRVVLPKHLDHMKEWEKRKCKRGLDELHAAIVNGDEYQKARIVRKYGFELEIPESRSPDFN